MATYNQIGRDYVYAKDTLKTNPSDCKIEKDVLLNEKLYTVKPTCPQYGHKNFCTYPNDTFAYELPSDATLEIPDFYGPYFPDKANPHPLWHKNPLGEVGDRLPPFVPPVPIHPPPYIPLLPHHPPNEGVENMVNVKTSGKLDASKDSLQAAQTAAHMYGHEPFRVPAFYSHEVSQNVSNISPGEQEVKSHRFTTINRYDGQRRDQDIFIKQTSQQPPYTPSLYQTPTDQTQNLVSTGKISNGYLGQEFEVFENAIPPPDTDKSMLKFQLNQPNPKLVWINGGYNHHNPPPRKREQPGEVFNPVSVKGGSVPFGSRNVYDPVVSEKMKMYGKRDIFNNRDGDLPVEPSLNGERPYGFVGLVPRDRYLPHLPATQELDKRGWMSISEDLNPDLTKRENYTGETFTRKPHLSTEYAGPVGLMNGVEVAGDFPLDFSKLTREEQESRYVTAPSRPRWGDEVVSEHKNRPTTKYESTFQVAGPSRPDQGGLVVDEYELKPSIKTGLVEHNLPVGNTALVVGGGSEFGGVNLPLSDDLKPSAKTQFVETALAVPGLGGQQLQGDVLVSEKSLKPSGKTAAAEAAFQTAGIEPEATGDVIVSEAMIRETLKMEDALRTPADPYLDVGDVVVANWEIKPTLKIHSEDMFAVNPVSSEISNFLVSDTEPGKLPRRVSMPEQKYANHLNFENGGELLPLHNATSHQIRGREQEKYVTAFNQVPQGVGGSSSCKNIGFTEPKSRSRILGRA